MTTQPRLVRDLLPGDVVERFEKSRPLPWNLPLRVEELTPAPGGAQTTVRARGYRARHAYSETLDSTLLVHVRRRRRPRIVENDGRLFQIRNKTTNELLNAKEMSTPAPSGQRRYRIQFAKDLWSHDYTDAEFLRALAANWEVVPQ